MKHILYSTVAVLILLAITLLMPSSQQAVTSKTGSVNVTATIPSLFTFAISGVQDGIPINTNVYCGTTHEAVLTNSGHDTTSTNVDLGTLTPTSSNTSAQVLTIIANSITGYSITATASGYLTNTTNSQFIPDAQGDPTANNTPLPNRITTGIPAFGIHACSTNGKVASMWGVSSTLFANPSTSFSYTLVNSTTPPAGNGDNTTVLYRATISTSTGPGDYRTAITYLAIPTF